jgi:hypothetical protein
MARWWPEPAAGDVVWCHFPDEVHPKPKPRPALIVRVFDAAQPARFIVQVAYGTSKKTTELHAGEFAILRHRDRAAFEEANLSFDTKFDLNRLLELPYSDDWFSIPPGAPRGPLPKLGTLHATMMRSLSAAYLATR